MVLPDSIFTLHGWCPKEKGEKLYEIVKSMNAKLVVELGVFGGRSFIPMALGLKDAVSKDAVKIIGVDPWSKTASTEFYDPNDPNYVWWSKLDHEHIFKCFLNSLKTYHVENISHYIRKTSSECVDSFEHESIDVLHQDANHSEHTSCEEVETYTPKVKPGGIWIMDDTDWATTSKAQLLLIQKGFELVEDHTSWKVYKKL